MSNSQIELKPEILKKCLGDNNIIFELAKANDRHLLTVIGWLNRKDSKLTQYSNLVIIAAELGLMIPDLIEETK